MSLTKTFYRLEVQDENGKWGGPFHGSRKEKHYDLSCDSQMTYGFNSHFVPPIDAYCGDNEDEIITGTHGPEGVLYWFPNVGDYLSENDARVMKYTTNDVRYEDDEQATFIPAHGENVTAEVLAIL